MSWFPVNKKHKRLEDTRSAFREYIMGDLAGDLELKYRGYYRLSELKELPQVPARRLPNKGFYSLWPIVAFSQIVNAIVAVSGIIEASKKVKP